MFVDIGIVSGTHGDKLPLLKTINEIKIEEASQRVPTITHCRMASYRAKVVIM